MSGWFINYGGPTGALTTLARLIIFLILLKIGWKASTWVGMTPVKSFLNRNTHSKVMIKNLNVPYTLIIGRGTLGSVWKS